MPASSCAASTIPDFVDGDVDTGFIGAREAELVEPDNAGLAASAALARAALESAWAFAPGKRALDLDSVWDGRPAGLFGFRLNAARRAEIRLEDARGVHAARLSPGQATDYPFDQGLVLELGEVRREVRELRSGAMRVGDEVVTLIERDGRRIVFVDGDAFSFDEPNYAGTGAGASVSDGSLRAPMPGKVVAVQATAGDTVTKGQSIVVVEAMKMEHALTAPFDGVVAEVSASVGDQVTDGAVLARVEEI
jgi:3-methylcrotonyl-CoA carboxylase alpha subunit